MRDYSQETLNVEIRMIQVPSLYSNHLSRQFNSAQIIIFSLLISLLQNLKTVRLEELAHRFPHPKSEEKA